MFGALKEWLERRRALRELRAPAGQNNKVYLGFFLDQISFARTALEAGKRGNAIQIWREMYNLYPDLCLTSDKALSLVIDLDCGDEAEALIQEGRRRYPQHKLIYAVASASVAHHRGDRDEAIRRCVDLRRGFPRAPEGYGVAASCLSELGRHEEAEAILELGVQKVPDDFSLNMRYAQAAMLHLDWEEGLRRWNVVATQFDHPPGPLGAAQCLKELGRLDEAEKVLTDACERFSSNPYPFVDRADLATARGDFEEAAGRWEVVLDRFTAFDPGYTKGAEAMFRVGRSAEADDLLRVVVERSPSFLAGHLEFARSADRREDWAAAAERWGLVRDRFPDCAEARERETHALALAEQARSQGH